MRLAKQLVWTIAVIVPVSAGSAQLRPSTEPAQRSSTPPPAIVRPAATPRVGTDMIAPVRLPSARLQLRPIRLSPTIEAKENDMTGWTQLTNGAAKGGPAVALDQKGNALLVVRGADDELYVTTLDRAAPGGPIDAAAWKAVGFTAASEPNCIGASGYGSTKVGIACAWLGSGGKPTFAAIGNDIVDAIDMGGINADARPGLFDVSGSGWGAWGAAGTETSVKMLVRDNGRILKRSATASESWASKAPNTVLERSTDTGWDDYVTGAQSSAQCDNGECAVVGGAGLMLSNPWTAPTSIILAPAPVPGGYSTTAPAPVRLPSGSFAVMVRNSQGKLYRITRKDGVWGKWADEGGTLKTGSSIACIANGEQPLCFAQGLDGRIYWKKLGTTSGL